MTRDDRFKFMIAAVLAAATAAAPGCGIGQSSGPLTESQMEDVRLSDVAELYRTYQQTYKKAPRSLKDLFKIGDATAPTGLEAIRGKQVVVRWNATLPPPDPEQTAPPSEEVLAYTAEVPQKGGAVLMLDLRIRQMAPEEFKTAKLAGTEPANGHDQHGRRPPRDSTASDRP